MRFVFIKMVLMVLVVTMVQLVASPKFVTANQSRPALDVLFVFDNSYFMRYMDPNPDVDGQAHFVAAAANLFVDMSLAYDFRFGYVMYRAAGPVNRGLDGVQSPAIRMELQREITSMVYDGYSDPEIALDDALRIIGPAAETRDAVIFLFTSFDVRVADGHFRTQEDAEQALSDIVARASGAGIPIHIIGTYFHAPDFYDSRNLFEPLAAATGGSISVANDPAMMMDVMRRHFVDMTNPTRYESHQVTATGEQQWERFVMPHESVDVTLVTLSAEHGVVFSSLTHVGGITPGYLRRFPDVVGSQEPGINRLSVTYIMRDAPMGNWDVTYTGMPGDRITISVLHFYDMLLLLNAPTVDIGRATFSWRAVDGNNVPIIDPTLVDAFTPVVHVTNLTTGENFEFPFGAGQEERTENLPAGMYEAYLTFVIGGETVTSPSVGFTIVDVVIAPDHIIYPRVSATLWTILPFLGQTTIPFSEIIFSPVDNRPHRMVVYTEGHEDVVSIDFSAVSDSYFTLTAVGFGNAEVLIRMFNVHEVDVAFHFEVRVFSGWIVIGGLFAIVFVVIVIMIGAAISKKPFLNDPMERLHIKMSVPISTDLDPPPEATLALPKAKGKKTLRQIISMNKSISEPYRMAFDPISWFYDNTTFHAISKHKLEIKPPSNPSYQIKIDNEDLLSAVIVKNGGTEITLGFYNQLGAFDKYVIEFGYVGVDTGDAHGKDSGTKQESSANVFWS